MIGIGINLRLPDDVDTGQPATDLARICAGAMPPRNRVVARVATRLVEAGALTSLVRAPALTATRAEPLAGRPQLDAVPLLRLSRADLTDWWAWASEQPGR